MQNNICMALHGSPGVSVFPQRSGRIRFLNLWDSMSGLLTYIRWREEYLFVSPFGLIYGNRNLCDGDIRCNGHFTLGS